MTKPILANIERRLVLRKLGQLQQADRKSLRDVLQIILG